MADLNKVIAPPFDPDISYEKGQCVLNENKLYRLTVDNSTVGFFKEEEWKETFLFDIVNGGNEDTPTLDEWKMWCILGGVNYSDYYDLGDVLDDEETIRRLMTIHASADYLYRWIIKDLTNDNTHTLSRLTSNKNTMKWIGLRDYICDKLMSVIDIENALLESEYWEYILKDHVPIMTSNTTPYGEVIYGTSHSSAVPYMAFNRIVGNSYWSGAQNSTVNNYIGYKFTNPICVKKVYMNRSGAGLDNTVTFVIEGSNDKTAWETLSDSVSVDASTPLMVDCSNNNNYYLYYRARCTASTYTWCNMVNLQFYGRSLNVSVPKMTSNTTPYGIVESRDYYTSGINLPPWKAFDCDDSSNSSYACANGQGINSWISYKNNKLTAYKYIYSYDRATSTSDQITGMSIYGLKENGTWGLIKSIIKEGTTTKLWIDLSDSTEAYYGIKIIVDKVSGQNNNNGWVTLQLYGVDYSEREFEQGSTMKYLYDHGVELESITAYANGATANKNAESLYAYGSSTQYPRFYTQQINLSGYSLIRAHVKDYATPVSYALTVVSSETAINDIAYKVQSNEDVPFNVNLPYTGGGTYMLGFYAGNSSSIEIDEWWIE